MHVAAMRLELHLASVHSLKEKRAVLRPMIEGCRRRFHAAVAEVDHQDLWQRGAIGVAVVSDSPGHACEMLDAAERFLWSFAESEVISCQRHWLEGEA